MIEFISAWADLIAFILSFCVGRSVFMIGNRGIIPNTSLDGTKPFSFIVSFIAFTATRRMNLFCMCGKSCLIFLKMRLSGPCNFSPIPRELWAFTPDNLNVIPLISDNFFHRSDVKTDP